MFSEAEEDVEWKTDVESTTGRELSLSPGSAVVVMVRVGATSCCHDDVSGPANEVELDMEVT